MTANAVRLQLHALTYNLASFFRTLVLPDEIERWSLTMLRETVVKIGAKAMAHARYTAVQMPEAAVSHYLFRRILGSDRRPATKADGAMLNPQTNAAAAADETDGSSVSEGGCLMGGAGAGWRMRPGSGADRAAQAISQHCSQVIVGSILPTKASGCAVALGNVGLGLLQGFNDRPWRSSS